MPYKVASALLGALLCCALCAARITTVPFVRQGNLYEWLPGDGTVDRANALGVNLTVGWHVHLGQPRENRALLGFLNTSQLPRGASSVTVVIDVLAVESDFPEAGNITALRLCHVLQQWGRGTSNATNATTGALATTGDATWRFPIYNASNPRTPYWDGSAFGGSFSEDHCILANLSRKAQQVHLNSEELLDNMHSWLIAGNGLILLTETHTLVTLCGLGRPCGPRLVFTYPPDPVPWYFYAVPAGAVSTIALVVMLIYIIRRKRLGYMPLHDLEDELKEATLILNVWRASLLDSGIRVVRKGDIQWGSVIGSGGSGTIYNGILGNQDVAIKCVNPKGTQNLDKVAESLIREILIMQSVQHKYILPLIGIIVGTGRREDLGFVMPLMPEGSLARVLHKEKKELKPKQEKRIALQIMLALQYLHSMNPPVLHRDVKSDNILVDKRMDCKLSDFGISRVANRNLTVMGTPKYIAPEAIAGAFSSKSDIYSYGVVLMEIITRRRPPDSFAGDRMLQHVLGVEIPNHEMRELTIECLEEKPDNRPTDTEVIDALFEIGARE